MNYSSSIIITICIPIIEMNLSQLIKLFELKYNGYMPYRYLHIIESTGDFNRIKMQVTKLSLWSRGEAPTMPLVLHCPLLAAPPCCTHCVHLPAVKHLAFRISH